MTLVTDFFYPHHTPMKYTYMDTIWIYSVYLQWTMRVVDATSDVPGLSDTSQRYSAPLSEGCAVKVNSFTIVLFPEVKVASITCLSLTQTTRPKRLSLADIQTSRTVSLARTAWLGLLPFIFGCPGGPINRNNHQTNRYYHKLFEMGHVKL